MDILFNIEGASAHADFEQPFINFLQGQGHTVDLVSDGDVRSQNLEAYDLLIIRAPGSSYEEHPEVLHDLDVPMVSMSRHTSRHALGMGSSSGSTSNQSWAITAFGNPAAAGLSGQVRDLYTASDDCQEISSLVWGGYDTDDDGEGTNIISLEVIAVGDGSSTDGVCIVIDRRNARAHWPAYVGSSLSQDGWMMFEALCLRVAEGPTPLEPMTEPHIVVCDQTVWPHGYWLGGWIVDLVEAYPVVFCMDSEVMSAVNEHTLLLVLRPPFNDNDEHPEISDIQSLEMPILTLARADGRDHLDIGSGSSGASARSGVFERQAPSFPLDLPEGLGPDTIALTTESTSIPNIDSPNPGAITLYRQEGDSEQIILSFENEQLRAYWAPTQGFYASDDGRALFHVLADLLIDGVGTASGVPVWLRVGEGWEQLAIAEL